MFTKSKISQSMLDAVNGVLKNQPVVEEKKTPEFISEEKQVVEVAPPGFEGTVRAMKKHKDISNPFALAWSMKNKGYKSHKKADGSPKNEEVESVEEELKGNQDKIDANHNGKIDGQDFKILRAKKKVKEEVESVEEGWDDMVKDAKERVKSGPKPNGGSGVKQGSRYGGSKQKEEPETQKEAVDPAKKTTDTLAGPVKGGKDNEHVGYKVKLKTEAKTLSPGQDDAPFDTQYSPSPMSRAKDLARSAMKRVKENLKDKK